MGKIGGLTVSFATALVLAGCTAPVTEAAPAVEAEIQQVAQVSTAVQDAMLIELRPLLKTLKSSDAELTREAYEACANLLFRSKDSYREGVMNDYASDLTLALDHLTVAAAAKQYICPAT
ncbi:hypothetical protein [Arthrobacter sp. YN]|uniref:hypothetical protein n=1 Tax=Arthrobacter sp. YN TaxID=2020486 RepID=UPI0012FE1252|nr:hypothetical protein [Arthrobacter sp. YN]